MRYDITPMMSHLSYGNYQISSASTRSYFDVKQERQKKKTKQKEPDKF